METVATVLQIVLRMVMLFLRVDFRFFSVLSSMALGVCGSDSNACRDIQ